MFKLRILLVFIFALLIPVGVYSAPQYSELAIDSRTGKILFAINEDKIRYPASFTKLITLYIIYSFILAVISILF